MPDRIVHHIEKRDDERVCFSVSDYKGHTYISIRIHFRGDSGAWLPTRKGITLSVEELEQIEAGVVALRKAIDAEPKRPTDRIERYVRQRRSA